MFHADFKVQLFSVIIIMGVKRIRVEPIAHINLGTTRATMKYFFLDLENVSHLSYCQLSSQSGAVALREWISLHRVLSWCASYLFPSPSGIAAAL